MIHAQGIISDSAYLFDIFRKVNLKKKFFLNMKNFTDPFDKSINKQYNVVQQYNAFI